MIQSQINRPFEDPLMDLNYLADIDHGEVRPCCIIKGKVLWDSLPEVVQRSNTLSEFVQTLREGYRQCEQIFI